ncbi:hypothetical protein K504DRAFT_397697 [Pleomassaria siparia CBS 279.74]|uniref:DUF7872 domain-containing protein n=1 Tax=Pleomassaria siparia CBS 279.74 TaxID=1314801 RepID=A0A6G1KJC0_9PLEO|nr:hypothetical protein K504DRAFT_397697 [Pleomassaria siparia CBS 279.74]
MRSQLIFAFATTTLAFPTPFPQSTGADSCPSKALTPQTWIDLKIDDFLAGAAKNYTKTTTNNVQALAASFGAPNFFCGLDSFCNAGQPCLPIELPAWYAAIAIQNWNNYMNNMNTAIGFASSILSLKLPEIVQDVFPDPQDNITPLKNMVTIFGSVLGFVPFTGAVATAAGTLQKGLAFVNGRLKPPAATDRFLAWSDVASSMADIVRDYQAVVSTSMTAILNAPVDDADNGINGIISGGNFLGVSQNFTQTDLQNIVIDSITRNALGLALQAQKMFVTRFSNVNTCNDEDQNMLCTKNDGSSTFTQWALLRREGDANAESQIDTSKVLMDKYGMTKLEFLKGPTDCFDTNGKKQLTNPFDTGLPTDAKAACVFNLLVCDIDSSRPSSGKGIVNFCKEDQGLDV